MYIYDESLIIPTVFSIYNWQCQPWGTLCHILFKSKRKTYFAKLFFQERKIPVNNSQSFSWLPRALMCYIWGFPDTVTAYTLSLFCRFSLKLSHFLLVLCIAFQRLNNIFSLILCEAPSPPPLPTLENKQLCEDCFALGQSAVCIRCKQGGTFLM